MVVTHSVESRGFKKIPKIPHGKKITDLRLSDNPLTTFEGLPVIPTLQVLRCDNTQIASFKGAVEEPALKVLSAAKTPVALCQSFRVMAAIVFGDSLEIVNQVPLKRAEIAQAKENKPKVRSLLIEGWIITNFRPLRLYNVFTRARRTIYVSDGTEVPDVAIMRQTLRLREGSDASGSPSCARAKPP